MRLIALAATLLLTAVVTACGAEPNAPPPVPQLGLIAVQSHAIHDVAFTPDGIHLVGGADDGKVYLWNAADGDEVFTFDSGGRAIKALWIAPDGDTVKTAGVSVGEFRLKDGEPIRAVQLDQSIDVYSFSPDGNRVVGRLSNPPDAKVGVWDASTGKVIASIDVDGLPLDAEFSPDGRLLAVGAATIADKHSDGALVLYDLGADGQSQSLAAGPTVSSVAFSLDGLLIAAGDNRKVQVWDAATRELRRTFDGHCGSIRAIVFSPDGATLASGGEGPGLREERVWTRLSEARLWNNLTGRLIDARVSRIGEISGLEFSPDGKRLARCDELSVVCEEIEGLHSWVKRFESTSE